jgi:alpha/beta superfamily hydrolase
MLAVQVRLLHQNRANMQVELLRVTTRDGCRLDGIWQAATQPTHIGLDACLLLHGTGGNFYSSTLLEFFADRLRDLGVGVLRINTRGHDGISTTSTISKGGLRLGAAYEAVDDCRHDLAAWSEWLKENSGPRVGWLGHSLGAVKCLYAATQERAEAPQLLLAVSPPRLSYSWYCEQPIREPFLEAYRAAEGLVETGKPQTLLDVKFPLAMAIAAAGYLEKYGPDERYNYLRFAASAPCPTRFLFGGGETANHAAFQQAPEEIQRLAATHPQLSVAVVPAADHFYTDLRDEAWRELEPWLSAVSRD